MDTARVIDNLVNWIREKNKEAGTEGLILGLSGGIDSALVATLADKACPGKVLGVIMPCHSQKEDMEHARLLAEHLGIDYLIVDLSGIYDQYLSLVGFNSSDNQTMAASNIKPRLRMITLYYQAQQRKYLVLGTGNRTELEMGYFTKYGDGGVDLLPIGGLVKNQVRELSRSLGVPQVIIDKPPSAGLWQGQTDEEEIGLTYEEMDKYILTGEARSEVKEKMDRLHRIGLHKLSMSPIGKY